MPLKREATQLLNNRFFLMLRSEVEAEQFEAWQNAGTVEDRESIYLESKVLKSLIERIEHEAQSYEPPHLGAA